jgi:protein-tyrosine phosphatase
MKILMVCLGNICRSPLAHGIVEHQVKHKGLNWIVDSAGTGNWHVGEAPDRRAVAVAKKNGIDISHQRAQHFTPELFDKYDAIFVMDRQNLKDVIAQAKNDTHRAKVSLFLDNDMVPDPYFDDAQFEPVFELIRERSRQLIEKLEEKQRS